MSATLSIIKNLVSHGNVRISSHGYDEMTTDGIFIRDIIEGVKDAQVVEDYPDYPKGPCVLVLQKDKNDRPIHVVWGISKGTDAPAVLITAYRPDVNLWLPGFLRRKK